MSENKISGAEALMRSLIEERVEVLFGYPGGQAIPIFDALYNYFDTFKYILTRHEQGATHAAEGYARVTGEPGVVIVTSGPGATNTITGIADAMLDSTPMVVICGQVGADMLGTDAFQETDVVDITQPITKWSYQVRSASEIPSAVARAFYIARKGRPGPVVLDITKNAQVELSEFKYEKCDFIRGYIPKPDIEEASVKDAADIINGAKKPLAMVGQGVILGKAENELIEFLEKADIPAASTLLGLSVLPSGFPLNVGMLGMHGNVAAVKKVNECDVLIAIGMRFDDRVTGDLSKFARQAKVIHLDIDGSEINKNVKADVSILGDVKDSLPMLTAAVKKKKHRSWIKSFAQDVELEKVKVTNPEINPECGDITMGEVINKVSEAVNNDAVLVTDVGQNQMMAAKYFKYSRTRSVVTSGGLGTMGYGLPAAIGAAIGALERTVCLFAGDGGFQMTIQELGTILEYKIPVKIILLNNNFLGMVRQWQELFFNERYSSTPMSNPDFSVIAAAYGIPSCHVKERKELDEAIGKMLNTDGPFFLNVDIEKNGMVYPMIPAGKGVDNLILGD